MFITLKINYKNNLIFLKYALKSFLKFLKRLGFFGKQNCLTQDMERDIELIF